VRIYVVTNKETGKVARYVRSKTLSSAIRAHAEELFAARAATTDEMFVAAKAGALKVLDATGKEDENEKEKPKVAAVA
jgi:hypothetical protein